MNHIGDLPEVCQRILSRELKPLPTLDEIAVADAAREKYQREAAERDLLQIIGRRYSECTVANFQVGSDEAAPKRTDVLKRCKGFSDYMETHIEAGGNVVICGPPGTGKDHLLVGLLREAITIHGASVEWRNGQELFRQFRDQIDSDKSEAALISAFGKADILAISDPVPPKGAVSPYATHMLYQILDLRYRAKKSCWITANVSTRAEAMESLSAPVFDRLLDNAFAVFCNWPSYREARKPEWLK